MTMSLIPGAAVRGAVERAEHRFAERVELARLLGERPTDAIPFGTSHAGSLAQSLLVKYIAAQGAGVRVSGLEATVAGLRGHEGVMVRNTMIDSSDGYFLLMLDCEEPRVVGLLRIWPLAP
ncbi:hypothetical protein [Cellulomonas alba]|uniref:SnoaL-like domain-containing protein n=1 Tax=Cellulomonas alba TaxID=3053467 RepID=A0ABT7SI41_9CELL|nr:hypothetical protein [Cellulomonas alba]MDM7855843.1 hypothetical protein [Cellulomonas alba]